LCLPSVSNDWPIVGTDVVLHLKQNKTKHTSYWLNRRCSPSETKQHNTLLTEQTLFSIWNKAKTTSLTEHTLFYIWNKEKQYCIDWTEVVLHLKQSKTILHWLNRRCSTSETKKNNTSLTEQTLFYIWSKNKDISYWTGIVSHLKQSKTILHWLNRHCSPYKTSVSVLSIHDYSFSLFNWFINDLI